MHPPNAEVDQTKSNTCRKLALSLSLSLTLQTVDRHYSRAGKMQLQLFRIDLVTLAAHCCGLVWMELFLANSLK